MAAGIIIRVAGEPVAKGRPRFACLPRGGVRAYTPARTADYETQLRHAAQAAMGDLPLFTGPLEIEVTAAVPIPRSWSNLKKIRAVAGIIAPISRPDADNYLKAACDALNQVVYDDDSQLVRMTVSKCYSATPSLTIEVRQLELGAA